MAEVTPVLSLHEPDDQPPPGLAEALDPIVQRLEEAVAEWGRRLRARSTRTAQRYGEEASLFVWFMQRRKPSDAHYLLPLLAAGPDDCEAYVNLTKAECFAMRLEARGEQADDLVEPPAGEYSSSSRAVKVAMLRSLFRSLSLKGLIASNTAADLTTEHTETDRHHKAVPEAVVRTVLDGLREQDTLQAVRDYAIVVTFVNVGLRRAELAGLRVGDVDRADPEDLRIGVQAKGGRTPRVPVTGVVIEAIDRWLSRAGHGDEPDAALFFNLSFYAPHRDRRSLTAEGVWRIVKRLFPGYSPHGLRARAITDVWNNSGGNLHMAKEFARHKTADVTDRVYIQDDKAKRASRFAPNYS